MRTSHILRARTAICQSCLLNQHSRNSSRVLTSQFHTSGSLKGLEEFFEDESDVERGKSLNVGRPWRVDELRIKSNEDLHKLWYVLLKERNMLLTMDDYYREEQVEMPQPERIEKVEESMENIMSVVKERDTAYKVLETGKTGEPEKYKIRNFIGIPYERTPTEHYVPRELNAKFKKMHPRYQRWMKQYLERYDEQLRTRDNYKESKKEKEREEYLEEFPNLTDDDVAHIKAKKVYKH